MDFYPQKQVRKGKNLFLNEQVFCEKNYELIILKYFCSSKRCIVLLYRSI